MIFDFIRWFVAKRDAEKSIKWRDFMARENASENGYLCEIVSIKQYARTGTKAYVKCHRGDLDENHAVWVPCLSPRRGDFILGDGDIGHGRHHNEAVFYFNEVEEIVKAKIFKGFLAHKKRLESYS